jgi:pyruvate dehydrogenase E2 component (dihydrolipoamide acetyltransferase)
MATKVIMPKLSPTMEEGQISRWLKKEGDKVSMCEPLAEIDTDKATMEMQALANGVLRKILINEGQAAPLGQTIAVIGEPDEDIAALIAEAPAQTEPKAEKAEEEPAPQPQAAAAAASAESRPASASDGRQPQLVT